MKKCLPLLIASLIFGCDPQEFRASEQIPGGSLLSFRCLAEGKAGKSGRPLESCGCSMLVERPEAPLSGGDAGAEDEGALSEPSRQRLVQLGSVACACRDAERSVVEEVLMDPSSCVPAEERDGCVSKWRCAPLLDPRIDDWVIATGEEPALPAPPGSCEGVTLSASVPCSPEREGEIYAYLGSPSEHQVALISLTAGARALVDLDESIPGMSPIGLPEIPNYMFSHPYGSALITISSEGKLSLISDHESLTPLFSLDLEMGPVSGAAVWPREDTPLAAVMGLGGALPPARLYLSAATLGAVFEIDLDRLSALIDAETLPDEIDGLFLRRWNLAIRADETPMPGALTVDPLGEVLAVAQPIEGTLNLLSLAGGERALVPLDELRGCPDEYLAYLNSDKAKAEDRSCADGEDNDDDGEIDDFDRSCTLYGSERIYSRNSAGCFQRSECFDGIDNDGNGRIDEEDESCPPNSRCGSDGCAPWSSWGLFEGPLPECADELDNDEDGLIDRQDPGCTSQADRSEGDEPEQGEALCLDGRDNDQDGLIDALDPGCAFPELSANLPLEGAVRCADGEDNDGDGLVDYPEDPGCAFAADTDERSPRRDLGLRHLELLRVPLTVPADQAAGVPSSAEPLTLYFDSPYGGLAAVDLALRGDAAVITGDLRALDLDIETVQALEGRREGAGVTLWLFDELLQLRGVPVTAPTQLTASGDRPIFARLGEVSVERRQVEAFYLIYEGKPWRLSDLDGFTGDYPPRGLIRLPSAGEIRARLGVESVGVDDLSWLRGRLSPLHPETRSRLFPYTLPAEGLDDPIVYVGEGMSRYEREWDRAQRLRGRLSQLNAAPEMKINRLKVSFDPAHHPTFCRAPSETELESFTLEARAEAASSCIPIGYRVDGLPESDQERAARREGELAEVEGVEITEDDPSQLIGGTFQLAWEGELPESQSRNGRYGAEAGEGQWTLVDLYQDFCAVGAEVGDLLVVDRFFPNESSAAQASECEPFLSPRSEGRLPLRYRITAVSPRQLTLAVDERTSYPEQVPQSSVTPLPTLAAPPAAPIQRCVDGGVEYRIKAGDEQWLLSHIEAGYRHPWRSAGDRCEIDRAALRDGRVGRARFDETFENEWFRFRLGALRGPRGIPEGISPYLIDLRFTFSLRPGRQVLVQPGLIATPARLRWLPQLDRLYIADPSLELLLELSDLDIFNQIPRVLQFFR